MLGPFPVGKLELDGDPAFQSYPTEEGGGGDGGAMDLPSARAGMPGAPLFDPALHLLSQHPTAAAAVSELAPGGAVHWRAASRAPAPDGPVTLQFPDVPWNEAVQSLSSMAGYEFQAWARAVTYARLPGAHTLSCQGMLEGGEGGRAGVSLVPARLRLCALIALWLLLWRIFGPLLTVSGPFLLSWGLVTRCRNN